MDSVLRSENVRPHAVCVPFTGQGHVHPMLKLAKLLHYRGFHITFVNTEFIHSVLLKTQGPDSLNGISTFRFETIPDGIPPSDIQSTKRNVASLCASIKKSCLAPFKDLLSRLNNTSKSNVPPVTCIVSDYIMSFTLKAAQELNIPNVLLWTASACGFMGYTQFPNLKEKGLFPLKDPSYLTNGFLDTAIDWIPGMEGIRLKNLPTLFRFTDVNDIVVNICMDGMENAFNASAIIFNTFDDLEHEILEALTSNFPGIYSIGPLQHLLNQVPDDKALSFLGLNYWVEEPRCMEWLDSKEPSSVVYVNFGSVTTMTKHQLVEFAWGLANSKKTFLWVIRPDMVQGESGAPLSEFITETKERGFLARWCRQEEVITHPVIGGYLTHCGWNSTMESLCAGVPMICWPFFSEQLTNCWFLRTKWDVGMELECNADRVEIERVVRELMDGEKGKQMKKKAMEWKVLAEKATTAPNGSSYKNFEQVINNVLLKSRKKIAT